MRGGRTLWFLLAGLVACLWAGSTLPTATGVMNHAPVAYADGPNQWPMFAHDLTHTGYNPDETQLQPPLRLKWTYTTGSHIYGSSPAVVNGAVYVGSDDTKVYALEAATGALKWSYNTGDRVDSSPAMVNGVVYVGSGDGKLYALDATTGALRWSYSTGGSI